MKDIRRIYILQQKKRIRNHVAMVGVSTSILGSLLVAIEQLNQIKSENKRKKVYKKGIDSESGK